MEEIVLYPHQKEAVVWMTATESRPRMVPDQPHGGILAHAMGLGKTMSMLSFIRAQPPGCTLVVCPKSLLLQWSAEAVRVGWSQDAINIYHGLARKMPDIIPGTHQLVLTTFDIVRLENTRTHRHIHTIIWDRVVLDEAHRICEQSSKTTRSIQSLRARNRWCITGTPFKNGISDLMALSRFLMVAPYCNVAWWRWYGNSPSKLREWRRLFLHLRDKSVLSLLPMKQHFLDVTLSSTEVALDAFLHNVQWRVRVGDNPNNNTDSEEDVTFTANHDQHELLRILRKRQAANHPILLVPLHVMKHIMSAAVTPPNMCEACGTNVRVEDSVPCKHALCMMCADDPVCAICIATALKQPEDTWLHSAKTRRIWEYLRDIAEIQHTHTKVVLFSQWTSCLDLLGWMLDHENIGYARYDGRVNTMEDREHVIDHFKNTPECQVLLTSLGAGGEGVNLTFASHVIIMEPYWNLAVEQQAIDRLHRIGQQHTTHVARVHVNESVETWVRSIQNRKTNELQRLLYEKIMTDGHENTTNILTSELKRPAPSHRLRAKFENTPVPGATQEGELGAFLVHPFKKIKLNN